MARELIIIILILILAISAGICGYAIGYLTHSLRELHGKDKSPRP